MARPPFTLTPRADGLTELQIFSPGEEAPRVLPLQAEEGRRFGLAVADVLTALDAPGMEPRPVSVLVSGQNGRRVRYAQDGSTGAGGAGVSLPAPPGPTARSPQMRGIKRRDTKPELALRSMLHRAGLRFRVDHPLRVSGYDRPIRPDVVFTRARLAVFWDGCFFHGCRDPDCRHGPRPQIKNSYYWVPKIEANRDRDARQSAALKAAGWQLVRFWGHEDPAAAVEVIKAIVRGGAR